VVSYYGTSDVEFSDLAGFRSNPDANSEVLDLARPEYFLI